MTTELFHRIWHSRAVSTVTAVSRMRGKQIVFWVFVSRLILFFKSFRNHSPTFCLDMYIFIAPVNKYFAYSVHGFIVLHAQVSDDL